MSHISLGNEGTGEKTGRCKIVTHSSSQSIMTKVQNCELKIILQKDTVKGISKQERVSWRLQ